jgi:hypothetical protein
MLAGFFVASLPVFLLTITGSMTAATSIVLLGDPQQLDQPQKGSHPDGVNVSALGHILGPHQTIPPDRGIFLLVNRTLENPVFDLLMPVLSDKRAGFLLAAVVVPWLFVRFGRRAWPVVLVAALGSMVNAIAGGGTLLTFPSLIGLGIPPIVANATGCMEVVSSQLPYTSWCVPWIHTLFENTGAVASGIAEGIKPTEPVFKGNYAATRKWLGRARFPGAQAPGALPPVPAFFDHVVCHPIEPAGAVSPLRLEIQQ